MTPYVFPDVLLDELLRDDSPYGDATTWGLGIGDMIGHLVFKARPDQIACCTEEAARMGALRGLTCRTPPVPSGTPVKAGDLLLTLSGRVADLHTVWKPAQTLMEYAGGIASATAELVCEARKGSPQVAIACTRKQVPGTKAMSVKAILAGGAVPHRLGLSETLLIFAEHRAFLGDEPPEVTVQRLHQSWPERQVVVEVSSVEEALLWSRAGADVVQLEKCSPDVVAKVVRETASFNVKIAAAGGVNASNAEAYARAGAHILVSSAPYNAKPRDVAVTLAPCAA